MNDQGNPEEPKIHIDSDWKSQAQAEKEKLSQQFDQAQQEEAGEAGAAGGQSGEMPPADFKTLVSTMATQALLYMGAIPDPQTQQRIAHPDLARHHIDMLGVIEEKTRGNLDEEEEKMVTQVLNELRQHFTQFSAQLAAHQAQQQAGGGQPGGPGGPGGAGGPGPIMPGG